MPGLTRVGERHNLARRHVAVLFADLSGFTRLVQSVDPEEVYHVVRPLMDEMVALVRAHGGSIQQVLGDGFMAVFGLHAPYGDEPARSVRAGLDLAGAPTGRHGWLPVHVGIEYGEVLVSPSWEPAAFGVWGPAVTIAKRLCDLAGPGRVHLGPAAFAHGGRDAACATPFRTRLKGLTGEVLAYTLAPAGHRAPAACRALAEVA